MGNFVSSRALPSEGDNRLAYLLHGDLFLRETLPSKLDGAILSDTPDVGITSLRLLVYDDVHPFRVAIEYEAVDADFLVSLGWISTGL